jgi:hypothetical protein
MADYATLLRDQITLNPLPDRHGFVSALRARIENESL